MSKPDMPELGAPDNPEIETAATGIWFSTAHDIFEHHVVGAHLPPPAPADPKRHAWPPLVLWLWMIREATHKDEVRKMDGRRAFVRRGSILASQRYLCVHANWNRKAMRLFLARLVKHGMVTVDAAEPGSHLDRSMSARGPVASIVTISNYSRYQFLGRKKGPVRAQLGPNKGPIRAQATTVDTETTDRETRKQSKEEAKERKSENVIDWSVAQRQQAADRLVLSLSALDTIRFLRTVGTKVRTADEYLARAKKKTLKAQTAADMVRDADDYCVGAARLDASITKAQMAALMSAQPIAQAKALAEIDAPSKLSDPFVKRASGAHGAGARSVGNILANLTSIPKFEDKT